jgi:hypothetical protein
MAVVRTDISEELSASFIRVTRIGELRTVLAVLVTEARCEETGIGSFETSVIPRAKRRNIPEDAILHKSNSALTQ